MMMKREAMVRVGNPEFQMYNSCFLEFELRCCCCCAKSRKCLWNNEVKGEKHVVSPPILFLPCLNNYGKRKKNKMNKMLVSVLHSSNDKNSKIYGHFEALWDLAGCTSFICLSMKTGGQIEKFETGFLCFYKENSRLINLLMNIYYVLKILSCIIKNNGTRPDTWLESTPSLNRIDFL